VPFENKVVFLCFTDTKMKRFGLSRIVGVAETIFRKLADRRFCD